MAVPTNLYQKASLKGDREDLTDKIYNKVSSDWFWQAQCIE